ncbi:MAG: two-component regulator propeller domain-containing protein [Acidobacteriota bacterium]
MLYATPLAALDPQKAITQYGLDRWTRSDGLPSNTVNAILQASDGYLWIGTEEGLARFDGVRFQVFDSRNTEALTEHYARSLFEDRDRTLWIATPNYLVSWRDGRWSRQPLPEAYSGLKRLTFYQSHDGRIWVGGSSSVGTLAGGAITELRDTKGASLRGSRAIFETTDGIWFGSAGLSLMKAGVLSTVCPSVAGVRLQCAVADRTGTIWFGTSGGGLGRYIDGQCSYLTARDGLSGSAITTLHLDRDGSLWIGPINGSLQRYRDGRLEALGEDELHSNQIMSLCEDGEGNIWIGTNGGGLGRLRDGKCTTFSNREGLGGAYVQAIAEGADGTLWVGTADGGLSRINDRTVTARYTVKDGLASNYVTCLWRDHDGTLWIGTDGGLNRMSEGRIRTGPAGAGAAGSIFLSIFEDREGVLWMGTTKGLFEYRDGVATLSHGITDIPGCIAQDRSGRLWVGTAGGGLRCISGGALHSYATKDGLGSNIVTCLYEDEAGAIWIGTGGGGLTRFRAGRLASVTTRQGLFADMILSILPDAHGNLWMSTNNGIFCARKSDLDRCADGGAERLSCMSFDESDGMRNRECFGLVQTPAVRARDGVLWFATVDGAVRIDPERLPSESSPLPIHIEQMIVNDKLVGDSMGGSSGFPSALSPGSSRVEIAYTGLLFADPAGVRFRYRLEGLDDGWVEGKNRRQAFYTNVPPGRYTFRVTAARRDGAWTDSGDSISFRILPHFYETTWFYALVAMMMLGAAYGGYRYRLQTLLELERVRTRIAADLHDDIGIGLTHITIISELIHTQLRNTQREAAELASQTADTARGLVDSLTDVVWAIDPKMDRVENLLIRIRQFASTVLEAKGIRFQMRAPETLAGTRLRADVRRQVLLTCKEAVNNIVRHAACSSVTLDLAVRDGHITGEIVDDGQGFDTENYVPKGSGRGLTSMRERVARLGGSLTFASQPGRGTRVVFSIPL